jgi:hypothetical protein
LIIIQKAEVMQPAIIVVLRALKGFSEREEKCPHEKQYVRLAHFRV